MIPTLPAEAIRAAISGDRLDEAGELIGAHAREVRQAVADGRLDAEHSAPWQHLLEQQQRLLEELHAARDSSADALQRLRGQRRGSQAYQQASSGSVR